MKLSAFKQHLDTVSHLSLMLPDGSYVPDHFHITEAGLTTKHFIDCGGTIRTEKTTNLQVWVAQDTDHRLSPKKLKKIIDIADPLFGGQDLDVEIEYQMSTIGRFGLDFDGNHFLLTSRQTDCLAKDHCGVPEGKKKVSLSQLPTANVAACCSPDTNCC
jgi:hypothetical protein